MPSRMNAPSGTGVGILGAGLVAYLHLLGARGAGMQLRALASRGRRTAEHRARLFGARAYTFADIPMIATSEDIDIIVVGGPNGTHAAHVRALLGAAKAILVEKPLTLTLEDADALCEAQQRGASIAYAENHIYTPLIAKARALIEAGEIGAVRRVSAKFTSPAAPSGAWHVSDEMAGGGVMVDMGSHLLATTQYLLGGAKFVAAGSAEFEMEGTLEIAGTAALTTGDGVRVDIACSGRDPNPVCYYDIEGEKGVLRASYHPEPQALTLTKRGSEQQIAFDDQFSATIAGMFRRLGYVDQLKAVVAAWRDKTQPEIGALQGRDTLEALCAIYLAARAGRRVDDFASLDRDRSPIAMYRG